MSFLSSALSRVFSTTSSFVPRCSVYISSSISPYYNLSFEDWLFRHPPLENEAPLLFIYRNEPCVIIGRNQNPWKELNISAGIPFLRRRSGGGTVYHDLGNSNFSLHLPRNSFERKKGSQMAVQALNTMGVPGVNINERNDVCINEYKIRSAYKIGSKRAYHHATMLLNAKLEELRDVLRTNKEKMVGRSVPSVRSPVRNVSEFLSGVDHEGFCQAVTKSFAEKFEVEDKVVYVTEETMKTNEFIDTGVKELQSWDWKYGQTLEFTNEIVGEFDQGTVTVDVKTKHGIITACTLKLLPKDGVHESSWISSSIPSQLAADLIGKKYGEVNAESWPLDLRDIARWLEREM